MTPEPNLRAESIDAFSRRFGCDVATLPRNVALTGWSASDATWYVAPRGLAADRVFQDRVPPTLRFLNRFVIGELSSRSFWFPFCFWDGWRERTPYATQYRWVPAHDLEEESEWRGDAGEVPILSPDRRPVACFGAHRGDPSALLLPEAHYLANGAYRRLFTKVRAIDVPWTRRAARAIYCGGNHGETSNYFPPVVAGRPHPRQYLDELAAASGVAIDVHLGNIVPLAEQVACKWILDVDGYARTWDAWAWKLCSGSTVLSPESPWESFFTRQFEPWRHYVPVANDFSDLAQKLAWCRAHDDECRRIAQRARRRAAAAYREQNVADIALAAMRKAYAPNPIRGDRDRTA